MKAGEAIRSREEQEEIGGSKGKQGKAGGSRGNRRK